MTSENWRQSGRSNAYYVYKEGNMTRAEITLAPRHINDQMMGIYLDSKQWVTV